MRPPWPGQSLRAPARRTARTPTAPPGQDRHMRFLRHRGTQRNSGAPPAPAIATAHLLRLHGTGCHAGVARWPDRPAPAPAWIGPPQGTRATLPPEHSSAKSSPPSIGRPQSDLASWSTGSGALLWRTLDVVDHAVGSSRATNFDY